MIDTLWVIAFNGMLPTSTKQWVEIIRGPNIVGNGNVSQILPQLTKVPTNVSDIDGWRIVCIANAMSPDTSGLTTFSTINNYFPTRKSYYYGGDYLPMYGDFEWGPASGYSCVMTRAVAKIQVQMGTSVPDVTGNFFQNGNVRYKIYHGVGSSTIQPPATGISPGRWKFAPETDWREIVQKANATEQDYSTYILEFQSSNNMASGSGTGDPVSVPAITGSTSEKSFHQDRLHIILEKNNGAGSYSFYRLDFYNPLAERFLDIQRNHHYLFTINKVRSEGYESSTQAQANPGSNIEYSILIDNGFTNATSNGQYAIVTTGGKDTIVVVANSTNPYPVVSAKYQIPPGKMTTLGSGTLNSITVNTITPGLPAFAAAATSPIVLQDFNQTISVDVLPAATNGAKGEIVFRLGNITHKVYFKVII